MSPIKLPVWGVIQTYSLIRLTLYLLKSWIIIIIKRFVFGLKDHLALTTFHEKVSWYHELWIILLTSLFQSQQKKVTRTSRLTWDLWSKQVLYNQRGHLWRGWVHWIEQFEGGSTMANKNDRAKAMGADFPLQTDREVKCMSQIICAYSEIRWNQPGRSGMALVEICFLTSDHIWKSQRVLKLPWSITGTPTSGHFSLPDPQFALPTSWFPTNPWKKS